MADTGRSASDMTLRVLMAAVIAIVVVTLVFAVGIGVVNFHRIGV